MKQVIIFTLCITLLSACVITKKADRTLYYSVQGGFNKGGIVENTDFTVLDNAKDFSEIDAYTGATKTGFNLGAHVTKPLPLGELETGVNYMYNKQSFSFNNEVTPYSGKREFNTNQFFMPFTYNINLLQKALPNLDLQLKIGYVAQLNYVGVNNDGTLPQYSTNNFSNGATFGFSMYPIQLSNGNKIGFFLDGYRGTQIYDDIYNKSSFEMPGSSYFNAGIKYSFRK